MASPMYFSTHIFVIIMMRLANESEECEYKDSHNNEAKCRI